MDGFARRFGIAGIGEEVRKEGTLLKTINTYIHFSFKSGDRDFDGGRSWAFGDGGICPREGDSGRRGGRKNLVFLINVPFFPSY